MCGFAGFIDAGARVADPAATLRAMSRTLVHRGPDDEGAGFDGPTRVGLAFRRLSILDLSPAGHQPMASPDGRFEIVFNGEVYNHAELRAAGAGRAFRGTSDTEAMLATIERIGVVRAVEAFSGMFAIAVLDRRERALWLARDRFGVKPLYYGLTGGKAVPAGGFTLPEGCSLAFASELKALRAMPAMQLSVDRGALTLFMRHGYVPGPLSIHPEVRKLRPGHLLRVDLATGAVEERCWWHSRDRMRAGCAQPFSGSPEDAVEAVDEALLRSVRMRMVADVPLGAFLSGGIDSSAVVAAMQAQSSRPVRTFTIGFGPKDFDEAPYARAVAAHLGTEHTEVYVTGEEALATVPRLAAIWDEPFADSSQIPTLLVSEIARRSVTVSLSGDGGDELFGGYYRYEWTRIVASRARTLPRPARIAVTALLRATPRGLLNGVGRALARVLPSRVRVDRVGDRAHKLARVLEEQDPWRIYLSFLTISASRRRSWSAGRCRSRR
jgi:asparagine synthase (glutamine-hydrolysing)